MANKDYYSVEAGHLFIECVIVVVDDDRWLLAVATESQLFLVELRPRGERLSCPR